MRESLESGKIRRFITRKNSLKIYVTTCSKYKHLLEGFKERFDQYWGGGYTVDISDKSWSDQMIDLVSRIEDEYFIRLCEDFWILEPVNKNLLETAELLAEIAKPDRIGLQSVKDGYEHCSEEGIKLNGHNFFKLKKNAEYMCSFEASIYKTEFLRNHLKPGLHIWESEIELSRGAKDALVYVSEEPVVKYKDATRRGKSRIEGLPDIV